MEKLELFCFYKIFATEPELFTFRKWALFKPYRKSSVFCGYIRIF